MSHDFSQCRFPPFNHQREDTEWLINRPFAFIASECRTGKTKIIVDTAQFLYHAGTINRVIVVAPAPVRDVWYDKDLGEIAKHSWETTPASVTEFHTITRTWFHGSLKPGRRLEWFITNYEFIGRSRKRLAELFTVIGPKTMLVLDESSFIKNYKAEQTRACLELRRLCGRVVLLNGTPLYHSPLDLFSQGNMMHPGILECKYITHFKSRYAVQAPVRTYGSKPLLDKWGKPVMKVEQWVNLEDLQRRFAPVTTRRLQAECLDLPPKLDPVVLTAALDPSTWRAYKQMRDELVVWLQDEKVARSATAAIRVLRLSQITSGFLGGIEPVMPDSELTDAEVDAFLENEPFPDPERTERIRKKVDAKVAIPPEPTQAIGREKLDVLLWFLEQRLREDPNLHVVVWCIYRKELARMMDEVRAKFPQFTMGSVQGGQSRIERHAALELLKPETTPKGPVFVGGIEGAGSFGLDMTAAHTCVTMSSGYSPGRVAQTLDRVYGPGQKSPVAYYHIIATGPQGQHTIDHAIEVARKSGQNVAEWTAAAWVKALKEN